MKLRIAITSVLFTTLLGVTGTTLACDGMGPNTHVGLLTSVNAEKHTFTIRDAQSQNPITFSASDKILSGLKNASGNIMVNYTEKDKGNLKAVGVTF